MGITRKFWRLVFKIGWQRLWKAVKSDIARILIGLGVLVFLSFLASKGLINASVSLPLIDIFQDEVQIGIVTALILAIILLLINVIVIPPEMYEGFGGFIENPITITPEPIPDKKSKNKIWRSLRVENVTRFDVTECMLRLMEAKDAKTQAPIILSEEDLTWSNREKESPGDQPKAINGGLYRLCDLVGWVWFAQGVDYARLTLAFGDDIALKPGSYILKIRVSGKWKGHNFQQTEEIPMRFDGKVALLGREISS